VRQDTNRDSERLGGYEDLLDQQLAEQRYAEVVRTVTDLVEDSTPTDRLLLLGARGLAGSGRHTAIRAWVARVTERMREKLIMDYQVISPAGDVHTVALGVGPGLFGIEWDWPPVIPGAELHSRRDAVSPLS
jgi:hypothetical protein